MVGASSQQDAPASRIALSTDEDEAIVDAIAGPDLQIEKEEERKDDWKEEGAVDLE